MLVVLTGCLTAALTPAGKPDLAVAPEDIVFSDEAPEVGETVSINVSVHNIGEAPASNVKVRISVDGVPLGLDKTVEKIDVNGTETVRAEWLAIPGTHIVKVAVDPMNSIPESSEDNNQAQRNITVGGGTTPGIKVTASAHPNPVPVLQAVAVNGTAEMNDQPLEGGDVQVTVVETGESNTTKTKVDGTFELTIRAPDTQGYYTLSVVVSYLMSEGNTTLQLTVVQPDLTVTTLSAKPSSPKEGEEVTFTAGIQNIGNGTASDFSIEYQVDDIIVCTDNVSQLKGTKTHTSTCVWKAEPGTHTVAVVVDPLNSVMEMKEDNNSKDMKLKVKAEKGSTPGFELLALALLLALGAAYREVRNI